MAFIHRDALSPAIAKATSMNSIYHKFKAVWPHDEGGVYAPKLYFYVAKQHVNNIHLKRFLVAMGLDYEEFITQPIDSEIEEMWFYLRPEYEWDGSVGVHAQDYLRTDDTPFPTTKVYNPVPPMVSPTAVELADKFNEIFTLNDEVEITIQYGGELKRYINEHSQQWKITEAGSVSSNPFNSEEVEDIILSNPWYYLVNSRHMPYEKNSNPFQLYEGDVGDLQMPKTQVTFKTRRNTPIANIGVTDNEDIPEVEWGMFGLMGMNKEWEVIQTPYDRRTSTKSTVPQDQVLAPEDWEDVIAGTSDGSDTKIGNVKPSAGEATLHEFKIKLKYIKTLNHYSSIIQEMVGWYEARYTNMSKIPKKVGYAPVENYKDAQTTSTIDTKFKKLMVSLMTNPSSVSTFKADSTSSLQANVTNDLYLLSFLRTDVAADMKRSDFVKMLGDTIDTDFKAEKASIFERILAVVIVVIAVIVGILVAVYTGGTGLALYSKALSASALVLGVGMYALTAFGGLSVGHLVKVIGQIATIVGIGAMLTGVAGAIQNSMKSVASKALLEQGIANATATQITTQLGTMSVSEIALGVGKEMLTSAFGSVGEVFTSMATKGVELSVSTVMSALETTLSWAQKGVELYTDSENKKLIKETEELQDEYDEITSELDNSRRIADPLYVLDDGLETRSSYDALAMMDKDWRLNKSPQGFFDEFESERSIK